MLENLLPEIWMLGEDLILVERFAGRQTVYVTGEQILQEITAARVGSL
jgi:hypothetical protein